MDREHLFRNYAGKLFVYFSSWNGLSIEDREDLVQETLCRVLERLSAYNSAYAFSTWVYTIARNIAVDRMRKEKANVSDAFEVPDTLPAPLCFNPEAETERETEHKAVCAFLSDRDVTDREITFLRFGEDMSCRMIGHIIGIPVGTVKYRLFKMRADLKFFMRRWYE